MLKSQLWFLVRLDEERVLAGLRCKRVWVSGAGPLALIGCFWPARDDDRGE